MENGVHFFDQIKFGFAHFVNIAALTLPFYNMLEDNSLFCQHISRAYCSNKFGQYGIFATIPLRTALTNLDIYPVETAFVNHLKAKPVDIASIPFEDSDFFTLDELRFFTKISAAVRPLTLQQIESDKLELSRETKKIGNVCKSHAEYLLKAIAFWELRYDSKYEEWKSKFNEAEKARILRLQLKRGQISPGEAASREVVEDDGYESGYTD